MLGQHLRRLNNHGSDPRDADLVEHLSRLASWRQRSPEEQWLLLGSDDHPFEPGVEPARSRIRLGLFCPCLGLGGAEAWQLALATALDPASVVWRGAVVTDGKRSVLPTMLGKLTQRMPVGYGLEAARKLASDCDVILSWSVLDYNALFRSLRRLPKVVQTCHFPGEMPWTPAAEVMLAQVDRLVAVSELAVESLPASLRDQANVIWNAVDPTRLEPGQSCAETRASWGVPPQVPVVGYLGRLAPEKDPDAMLRLAEHLPAPWHVVLVGDGRETVPLRQKIRQLNLDRVHLVPGTAEVGNVLNSIDTLVVPSLYESFGLTMAEGFWTGVPVLATRVGLAKLQPDLVRELEVNSDGATLAAAVQADHDNAPGTTRHRIVAAQSFARERLDLARFGREWTDLCSELVGPTPHDRAEEAA